MDTREPTALDQGIEALQDQISELTASAAKLARRVASR
jgi:hypothetical protein